MIEFTSENGFELEQPEVVVRWIGNAILEEGKTVREVDFIFCSDVRLHEINLEFLDHDTLTDVISFDYSIGNSLAGEIYISTDRVAENADTYAVSFLKELHRVLIHGILHLCGYKDKQEEEVLLMRSKEEFYLEKLTVLMKKQ